MGQGETGIGESPSFHPIIGGIPMKKKVFPKANPKKLAISGGYKKSFNKFSTKGKKIS